MIEKFDIIYMLIPAVPKLGLEDERATLSVVVYFADVFFPELLLIIFFQVERYVREYFREDFRL